MQTMALRRRYWSFYGFVAQQKYELITVIRSDGLRLVVSATLHFTDLHVSRAYVGEIGYGSSAAGWPGRSVAPGIRLPWVSLWKYVVRAWIKRQRWLDKVPRYLQARFQSANIKTSSEKETNIECNEVF